ncbi:hypothetical protein BGX30_008013, partial [Mortierella sp. GBA39]
MKGFDKARGAITEGAFRSIWMDLCKEFGAKEDEVSSESEDDQSSTATKNKDKKDEWADRDDRMFAKYGRGPLGLYMRRLRRRREHWAGPW